MRIGLIASALIVAALPAAALMISHPAVIVREDEAAGGADYTTGLILHWNFNSGNGSTQVDQSGNSNSGVQYTASAQMTVASGYASANGGADQSLATVSTSLLNGQNTATVSMWAQCTYFVVSLGAFTSRGTSISGLGVGTVASTASGSYRGLSDGTVVGPTTNMVASVWHHLVLTYDQARNPRSIFYLDGVQYATDNTDLGTWGINDAWRAGCDDFSTDRYFYGLIDECRLYTRTLTAADVAALYAIGRP